jgi:hypothetical protein
MDESHPIHIFGRGSEVVVVAQILQAELDNMEFRTISLHKDLSKFILDNIKEIKSLIDPCEIRVKRTLIPKDKTEMKNPFYTLPMTTFEVCLIGTSEEVKIGERKLFDFCDYRQDAPAADITSLYFLLPSSVKFEAQSLKLNFQNQLPKL